MKKIIVITADIINSRRHQNFENNLSKKITALEDEAIISKFTLSRGDEIQGVLNDWANTPEIVRKLRYYCQPLQLRVGIGIGNIEENKIDKNSWKMNGEPFFLAREAVDEIKKIKKSSTILKSGNNEIDKIINCIWLLIDVLERKWSEKQWKAIHLYEEKGTFEEAANIYGTTWQNVQKLCNTANYEEIHKAEKMLKNLIEKVFNDINI